MYQNVIVSARLAIQFLTGVTPKGRSAHRTFSMPYFKPEASSEEIIALIELMRGVFIYPITGVRLIVEKKTVVWTPEMRVRKNVNENEDEEELSGRAQQQRMTVQNAVQSSAQGATTGVSSLSVQSSQAQQAEVQASPVQSAAFVQADIAQVRTNAIEAAAQVQRNASPLSSVQVQEKNAAEINGTMAAVEITAPLPARETKTEAVQEVKKPVKKAGGKSFLTKLHDFFIDDSYLQKSVQPKRVVLDDYSHIDWSKVSPVAQLQAKYEAERAAKAKEIEAQKEANKGEIAANEEIAPKEEIAAKEEAIEAKDEVAEATTEAVPDLSHLVAN